MRHHFVIFAFASFTIGCDAPVPLDGTEDATVATTIDSGVEDSTDTSGATASDAAEDTVADTALPLPDTVAEVLQPTEEAGAVEGETVIPQTVLHLGPGTLDGVSYRWEVVQPEGSTSIFHPNANVAYPTLEANVSGRYAFTVHVGDDMCIETLRRFNIDVVPAAPLHIELTWHTPNDPDETNEGPVAGSDLDLHFASALADSGFDVDGDGTNDPWFSHPFDCYWFNTHPNWGSIAPELDDDPALDRDDTDGGGPENLNYAPPEPGCFALGVHVWNDHGFGTIHATIRVFEQGVMVAELERALVQHDMWQPGHVCWTSGGYVSMAPNDVVTPDYVNPDFPTDDN